jgi:hypothetical protein
MRGATASQNPPSEFTCSHKLATLSAGALLLCHSASGIAINILGAGDFAARDIAGITGNTGG